MIKNAHIVPTSSTYHADHFERGDARFVVSYSMLKEFAVCPSRWRDGYNPPESLAKDKGSLIDCLLLTPDECDKRYKIPPVDYVNSKGQTVAWTRRSTTCTAWEDEERERGFTIVDVDEVEEAQASIVKLQSDPLISSFLKTCQMQVQIQFEWHDHETKRIIPCRSMVDLVPDVQSEFGKNLGDYKHVRSAGVRAFKTQVFSMMWHMQSALYTDAFVAATGEDRCSWVWIVQESFAPWQCGRRMADPAFTELGRATYRRLLSNYAQCLEKNEWPDYDEHDDAVQGWTIVRPDEWMMSALPASFGPSVDDLRQEEPEPVLPEDVPLN